MRAVQVTEYGDASVLETRDVPRSDPGPGEVRIDVDAAGLNFADVEKRRGNYPDGPAPPFVGGMEAAGRIDAVGDGVSLSTGEPVVCFCDGAFAESVVVDADTVFDCPSGLDPADAAGVPIQFLTAHNCLHEWGGLEESEVVLVFAAAGGVGSAAVQLAREAGATVVGAAGSDEKLAFVRDLGADHAINYENEDITDAATDRVDAEGIDLVLDGVGGSAFRAAVDALAPGGRIVTYGMASGRPGSIATPRLLFGNNAVLGYHLGNALDTDRDRVVAAIEPLWDLLESGTVSVQLDRRFDFEEAAAAYERLEDRSSRGKIVLEP